MKLQKIEKFNIIDTKINKNYKYYKNLYFDYHIYFFKYKDIIRQMLIDYKFNEKPYMHRMFVSFILKHEKLVEILKSYDKIVPVPISKKRYKKRGYNQSYLIAKEIAKSVLNIKCDNNILMKEKDIIEQSKLNREQRKENIIGAYKILNCNSIKNKNIILIDDIYTTGSTVNECSKVLKEAGANKIAVLTIAKD